MNIYGVEEIYKDVIEDVIDQSREAFLDEGLDIDVIKTLKESWKKKIFESGVIINKNQQQKTHRKFLHQLDGGGPGMMDKKIFESGVIINKNQQQKTHRKFLHQLDGGGPGMMDSSSESEEEEENIAKVPIKIENTDQETDQNEEEKPLNSDDDLLSEDDEQEGVFDVDNIVVCQFKKITRQRPNKWKFELNDGIMHIDGKDYCFNKCAGDAEW